MEKLVDLISQEVAQAFAACGFDPSYGKVTVSNRPDLCEYQCNGSLPAAKVYHKAPMDIAQAVAEQLSVSGTFAAVEAAKPGFLNLKLTPAAVADYLNNMAKADKFGLEPEADPGTIVVDYGGPNVAKPLHVGHLRSAIIGESIKRIFRYFGNTVIGDVHLGDWGLQMGLIIAELHRRQPDLPYFDPAHTGPYPAEAPFTISELEEIYPAASARSKEDEDFAAEAHNATVALQHGDPAYTALWKHIMAVSVADLKQNYAKLNVDFDVWLGESDAQPDIPPMLEKMKASGVARESDGAWVIDVQEDSDKKEIPPCLLVKQDGGSLYATTDLATMVQRVRDYNPDRIFYITDKRQSLHFEQVFRAARKSGIVPETVRLDHLGFGTMNGKDGKPFKTRAGGVMRLETLIGEVTQYVYDKISENNIVADDDKAETARLIAMAALKYGDLSNLATKDYVFDLERFSAFEGNTGPYILYTIVRIKSILAKYGKPTDGLAILPPTTDVEKDLMLSLSRFADNLQIAYRDATPNTICAYIYELAGAVNKFYHETRILAEEDADKQAGYIALISLTKAVLETCIDLLGFAAPDKM
jgi:arginyl-tRNA synthetase